MPTVTFEPESYKPEFHEAVREYEEIWAAEGERIVEALERFSGREFAESRVAVVVYEGMSMAGGGDRPMKLRASYPFDTKKATLVHELGHRVLGHERTQDTLETHKELFLTLYDVWAELYGQEFADEQVEVEKKRADVYVQAWDWALGSSRDERQQKFSELQNKLV